jgi:hypothetical protein
VGPVSDIPRAIYLVRKGHKLTSGETTVVKEVVTYKIDIT